MKYKKTFITLIIIIISSLVYFQNTQPKKNKHNRNGQYQKYFYVNSREHLN